jgi:hypothetical protein
VSGLRLLETVLPPLCMGVVLALTLPLAPVLGLPTWWWIPSAVLFGAALGYSLVRLRRPRRLHGGMFLLCNGLVWLVAALWLHSVASDLLRPLLLFISAGASFSATLLADDPPRFNVGRARRRGAVRTRG